VTHQQCAEALSLIIVDHDKGDLGFSGFGDDVPSAADDDVTPVLPGKRDQGDVIGKVDIHEVGDFLLREAAFDHEEAALQRLRTGAADRRQHVILVVRPQRTDLDVTAVTQALGS